MRILIQNGTILTPDETLADRMLVIEDGRISAVEPRNRPANAGQGEVVLDARGLFVGPGLIDVHIHGCAGSDVMDATPLSLHTMARFMLKHGVTGYMATTITAPGEAIQAAIENVLCTPQPEDGAQHLGIHLEGPYLSAGHRGAQPLESLRLPDNTEYQRWFENGSIKLMAVAPEKPGALELIDQGTRIGVHFSVGHSEASYDQVEQAVAHGLDHATHTFNGMLGIHHREPGPAGAVLVDNRIYAEVIADGIHLHPAIVKLIVLSKGPGRVVLVTDAMRAAGLPDGEYDLGGEVVQVFNGVCRNLSGNLAGSTLTLERAVKNTIQFAGISMNQALAMATRVAAESVGLGGQKGLLKPGASADVIVFDRDMNIYTAIVDGRIARNTL